MAKKLVLRCEDHPTYRAERAPRNGCSACIILWTNNRWGQVLPQRQIANILKRGKKDVG